MKKEVKLVANRASNLWRDEVSEFFKNYDDEKRFINQDVTSSEVIEEADTIMDSVYETIDNTFSGVSENNRATNSSFLKQDEVNDDHLAEFEEYVHLPDYERPILIERPKTIKACDSFNVIEIPAKKYLASKVRSGVYSVLLTSTSFQDIEGALNKLCEEDPRFYFAVEFCMLNLDQSKELIISYLNSLDVNINISRIKFPTVSFERFKNFVGEQTSAMYADYQNTILAKAWILEKDIVDFVFVSLIVLMWRTRINFEIAIKEHFLFTRRNEYGSPIEDLDFLVRSYWEIKNSKEIFQLFKELSFGDEGQTDRLLIDDSFEVRIQRFLRALSSINSKRKVYEGDALIISALVLSKNKEIPFLQSEWQNEKILNMPELQALGEVYQVYSSLWEDSSFLESVMSRPFSIPEVENTIRRTYEAVFAENNLYQIRSIQDFKNNFDIILTRNRTDKATGLEVKKVSNRQEKYVQISFGFIRDKVIYSSSETDAVGSYVGDLYQKTSSLGFKDLSAIRDFSCDLEKNLGVVILDGSLNPRVINDLGNISFNLFCFSVTGKAYIMFPDSLSEFCKSYVRSVILSASSDKSEEAQNSIFEAAKAAASSVNFNECRQCYKILTNGAFIEGIDNSLLMDEMWVSDGILAVMDYLNRNSKTGREIFIAGEIPFENINPIEIKGGSMLYPSNKYLFGKRLGERRKIPVSLYGVSQEIRVSVPQLLGWKYMSKQTYIFDRERFINQEKTNQWITLYKELQDRVLEGLELNNLENFSNIIALKRAKTRFFKLNEIFHSGILDRVEQSLLARIMSKVSVNSRGLSLLANPIFRSGNDNLVKLLAITLLNNEFEIIRDEILLDWVQSILNSDAIYNISIA